MQTDGQKDRDILRQTERGKSNFDLFLDTSLIQAAPQQTDGKAHKPADVQHVSDEGVSVGVTQTQILLPSGGSNIYRFRPLGNLCHTHYPTLKVKS